MLIPALVVFVLLYAGLLAVAALVVAVRGRRPGPGLLGGVILLELTLVGQAVLDGIGLATGRPVPEPATHLGYLVTSVAVLPLLLGLTRSTATGSLRPGPARPVAARPVAARPVAARPVAVRPVAVRPVAIRSVAAGLTAAVVVVACAAVVVVETRLVATGPDAVVPEAPR